MLAILKDGIIYSCISTVFPTEDGACLLAETEK